MSPVECVQLVTFLAARCPAMRIQDGTPDAWYVDLAGVDLEDGYEAVVRCTRRQTFVGLNDLLEECAAIVRQRLGREARERLDAEIAAENPPLEVTDREAPLRALMAGTPVRSVPRPTWRERRRAEAQRSEPADV